MIKRRDFLINTGLALGTLMLAPAYAFNSKNNAVGIQLWSLRDSLPKDVKGILSQLGNAGFNEVETYGYSPENGFFGTSLLDFKSILKDNNLKATSHHFDFNLIFKDNAIDLIKSYIEAANTLESEYVTIPYLASELRGTVDDYKKVAHQMNTIGELCHKGNLKLAYHNHDFEFAKLGATSGYEILLKETDKNLVDFEIDLYWAIRSGKNPLDLFTNHPGRFKMWHVKDMDKLKPEWNTEIGSGTIDFKSIFAHAELAGMKRFFLEQESNYQPAPLESVVKSLKYIKKHFV